MVNHFSDLTKTAKRRQSTGSMASYKLPTDYFALGPNCTTLSVEAAKKAVPRIVAGSEKYIKPEEVLPWHARKAMEMKYGTPKHIFLPANLKTYLDAAPAVRVDEKKTYGGGK